LLYKLQYIERLKAPEKWYFSFGTSMHSCVEQFFRVKTPPAPTLEELMGIYEKEWLSAGYTSPEEEARYKLYGKDILKKFWEIHAPTFRIPIALERRFFLDIEGIKLMGFIDRVDKLESGGLSIVDYKTNQELFTNDYVDNNLQLTIYQMAAEQTWRLPVEKLTLYHLRTNTPCTTLPRSKEQTGTVTRLVLDVAGKIQRDEFPATENEFCPCDFPQYCPYYKHKYLTAEPAKEMQARLPGIDAADAANRYAALQAKIKELETELNRVKQNIIDYCREQGLNRVFGDDCQITYKMVEKTGYDEPGVKALLEPSGLWEKVLSFDPALLKRLIAEGALPPDIKQKIESLKNIKSAYPQLWIKHNAAEEEEE
jgi:putative RecB family exonuclease